MSEILRDYTLEYNLETSKIKNDYISFYNTDKNISTLFVKLQAMNSDGLLSYLKHSEAINHSILLTVRKPKTGKKVDATGILQAGEDDDVAIFRFNLPSKFTNQAGECFGELLDTFTENGIEKHATSDVFSYTIKASQMKDLTEEPVTESTVTLDTANETLSFSSISLDTSTETATI